MFRIHYITQRGDKMRLTCSSERVSWHRRRIHNSGGEVLRVERL